MGSRNSQPYPMVRACVPVVSQVQRIVCTNMNNFSVMLTAPAKPGKGRTSKPTDTLVFTVENPQAPRSWAIIAEMKTEMIQSEIVSPRDLIEMRCHPSASAQDLTAWVNDLTDLWRARSIMSNSGLGGSGAPI